MGCHYEGTYQMATVLQNPVAVKTIRERMMARQRPAVGKIEPEQLKKEPRFAAPVVAFARIQAEIVPINARPLIEAPLSAGTKPVPKKVVHRPRVTTAMLHAMECTASGPYRLCTGTTTGHRGR